MEASAIKQRQFFNADEGKLCWETVISIWKTEEIYFHGCKRGRAIFSVGSLIEDRECEEVALVKGERIRIQLLGE